MFTMADKILDLYYTVLVSSILLAIFSSDSNWFANVSATSSDQEIKFIPWGKTCKLPSAEGFLLPHEECDQSKGIFCQTYQQGLLCGCKIGTHQSYDAASGECRKKPNHNCAYVDPITSPGLLEKYPYHVKCHTTADCILVPQKNSENKKRESPETVGVCRCKPGYVLSRDQLQCVSATGGVSKKSSLPIIILLGIVANLVFTQIIVSRT